MRKDFFGIAATMLLVGTMAITSCSDDCVFGYDEEWDDMIPRTKQIISTDPPSPAEGEIEYHKIETGECSVVALAQTRGQLVYLNNNMYVEINNYYDIVADIASSITDYQNELYNDSCITRTDNQWKEIFGCTNVVSNDDFSFGTKTLKNINWYGHRTILGEPHIDYITKYIPATATKEAQVVTGTYGRVNLSEYYTIYK
jgi:hypothetical protein